MISDKAKACPKCGYVLNNEQAKPVENIDDEESESQFDDCTPQQGGGLKWILIVLAILVIGGGVGYYFYADNKAKKEIALAAEQARLDSIEAARLDSIRQDSIAFYEFTSNDLKIFDVKGHVQEMTIASRVYPSTLPFDYRSAYFSYDGEVQLCAGLEDPIRNNDGRIEKYFEGDSNSTNVILEWNDGRIVKTTRKYNDSSNLEYICTPTYQDERVVSCYTVRNQFGKVDSERTTTIEYLSNDEFGNWTSCLVKEDAYYPDGIYNHQTRERIFSKHFTDTLKREIKYYSRKTYMDEERTMKKDIENYKERRNAEIEAAKVPDWMQGTWHLDIGGPNGISVANYTIIIDGNNATLLDGRQTKYKGECHVDNGKLYLGNSSSYDIRGQSLYYRYTRLTKEGSLSSWSGSFGTDSDVMRYLTDRTFYSESHRMSFTYNSCKIDGYAVSGAPRISNFSSTSATIVVNPLGGGRAVYLYLNASNGTINYEGDIFRAR